MGFQLFVVIIGLVLCYLAIVIFSPFILYKAEVIKKKPKDKSIPKCRQILGEKATVIKYPVGHFDIYRGEIFDKTVDAQQDFLKRVL